MDGLAFEIYIRTLLAPALNLRTVVMLDNFATDRNVAAAQTLKIRVCWFLFLQPYSPHLNLIEIAFSRLKAHLRGILASTTISSLKP